MTLPAAQEMVKEEVRWVLKKPMGTVLLILVFAIGTYGYIFAIKYHAVEHYAPYNWKVKIFGI